MDTPAALGAGNALLVLLQFEHVTEVVSAIGEKGCPAESVVQTAAADARTYLEAEAPVSRHLADQLLLPLLMGGGQFRATTLTPHARTNAALIAQFVDDPFALRADGDAWVVAATGGGRS